jgi:hypothetical protein
VDSAPHVRPFDGLLLALFVAACVSTILARPRRLLTIIPSAQRADGLLTLTMYLSIAFLVSRFTSIGRDILTYGLICAGTIVSIIGIFQARGKPWFMPAGMKTPQYQGRAWGTLGNPVFLGGYLCLILPLTIMYGVLNRTWWVAPSALLMGVTLVLSGTRSAWGAALCGMAVIPFVVYR